MAKIILLFVSIAISHLAKSAPPQRIVGGHDVDITEHPYMVSLRYLGSHMCGGVLITKRHVLTAGHCVQHEHATTQRQKLIAKRYLKVASGSTSCVHYKNLNKVASYDVHPNYNGSINEFFDDIAVITLAEEIELDSTQQLVALPSRVTSSNRTGFVVGWGQMAEGDTHLPSPNLQRAFMTTITNSKCAKLLNDNILGGQLCAHSIPGVGFCDGDSGGPLIIDNEVVGIVSASDGCGTGLPDVYTRVHVYLPWILEKIQQD